MKLSEEYAELAEACMDKAAEAATERPPNFDAAEQHLKRAQVYATLAQAAATKATDHYGKGVGGPR